MGTGLRSEMFKSGPGALRKARNLQEYKATLACLQC